jgi:hypothetical protein
MSEAWIETASGIKFDLLDPQPDMVKIEDIAHALSQQNRFTGHAKFPYPVSQHCRLGSLVIEPKFALEFLLHDASEAYLSDWNRSLKHFTVAGQEYMKMEKHLEKLLADIFHMPYPMSREVKLMDNMMLYAEKAQLMRPLEWSHDWSEGDGSAQTPADVTIYELTFQENKFLYLNRFEQLVNQ